MGLRHHVVVVTGASSGIGREQGTGTLINIASSVGAVARPYSHPYGLSKHAVRALGSSLRQQLRVAGVKGIEVCTVRPATALVRQARRAPGLAERAMARQTDRTHLSHDEDAPATHGAVHVPAEGEGSVHGGWGGRRRIALRRTAVAAVLAGAAVAAGRRATHGPTST